MLPGACAHLRALGVLPFGALPNFSYSGVLPSEGCPGMMPLGVA
jgi:hypothetical protein